MHKKFNLKNILIILLLNITFIKLNSDNRYIPIFPNYYKGQNTNISNLNLNSFYIFGGTAYHNQSKAITSEAIIGYPELNGAINLHNTGKAFNLSGTTNPIPLDWRWSSDFNLIINGHL